MKKISRYISAAGYTVATVASSLMMVVPARAVAVNWDGGGTDNLVSNTVNWELDTAPVCTDSLTFPSTSGKTTVDIDLGCSLNTSNLGQIVFNGDVLASSHNYILEGDSLVLTGGILAEMTGTGGDHTIVNDITLGANQTFSTDGSNTLVIGSEGGMLDLSTYTLTLLASGGSINIVSDVTGSGNITVSGLSNEVKLTGDNSGYTGSFTVDTGTYVANGLSSSAVTVSGGILKGIGSVGDVSMSSGTVAPGLSPGTLNTGDLVFTGGNYDVELGGTLAGEYDQLNVTGTVDLGTATTLTVMQFGTTYVFAEGDTFTIINNDGTDAVTGTFTGYAEGDSVSFGIGQNYTISYVGGDGNDVTLVAQAVVAAPDTGFTLLKGAGLATLIATIMATATLIVIAKRYEKVRNN